ncbi:hypothetical protein DAPPUDRAFT_340888 [Daphnia pulex]|uniref:Uncharacterized protein n=1 Tax=Daphnia pulex TaxID=6669 RepID=E9I4W6_DAPPU|nr:hypothetical protein DAPPUDRAFT_340888 [Daphnia pulex]|eukprot:EFX60964.1 hypothetical protein DAPPUDRAFT_340888 [Daphnia pulex]
MEHAQTCPTPDVVAVMMQSLMTQQPASPPDVYSIALMTKSSRKRIEKESNFTLDQNSPDLNGAQVARICMIEKSRTHLYMTLTWQVSVKIKTREAIVESGI